MRRDLFPGIPEEEFLKLAGGPQAPASVNVYLLRSGGKLILLDTGYGGERGSLLKKLEALKISPDQIDAVLLTHMHGDHIGGLLTEQGNAVFPKATIHVSEPEHAENLRARYSKFIWDESRRSGSTTRCFPESGRWTPPATRRDTRCLRRRRC